MGESSDQLVSTPVTILVLAVGGTGLLVSDLYPDAGLLTTVASASYVTAILGFSGYVLARGLGSTDDTSSVSRPTMRKSIKGVSDPSEIVLPHQTLFGVPMVILKALPASLIVAILPFLFPGPPAMPVPSVGWVVVPWYTFPAVALVGFGLTCWYTLTAYNYI